MSDEQSMMPISATRAEVADQPAVVARVLADLAGSIDDLAATMAARGTRQVLASGSGDSWFAAQAVALGWERYAGIPIIPLQAYEYAAYGRLGEDAATTHLVISSSGRPTTTWDALDRALAAGGLVVGVTDNASADNPFVARPPVALVPGASKRGWPAQTTTATMAALLRLAIAFGRERGHLDAARAATALRELDALPGAMAGALRQGEPWAESLAPSLDGRHVFALVGGGPSFAVAQNGSALLAEGPQALGLPLTVEEFHHALRIATLGPGEPVILIAPAGESDARCRDTARVVRAWGARLISLVTPGTADIAGDGPDGLVLPAIAEPFSPLLTLLPLQQLSIALAARKVAAGHTRPRSVPT